MNQHPREETGPERALRLLREAAQPYTVRVVHEEDMILPDFVFLRPEDGLEVMRYRYFEPEGQDPYVHAMVPGNIGRLEELKVEAYLSHRVVPVIQRDLTLATWVQLSLR